MHLCHQETRSQRSIKGVGYRLYYDTQLLYMSIQLRCVRNYNCVLNRCYSNHVIKGLRADFMEFVLNIEVEM